MKKLIILPILAVLALPGIAFRRSLPEFSIALMPPPRFSYFSGRNSSSRSKAPSCIPRATFRQERANSGVVSDG